MTRRNRSSSPRRIGIKNPQDLSGILGAVDVADGSVVTSGLYERSFVLNGVRYAHV
ncbi:FAD:protein FMN transferase [Denitrobacterium detoxificans]|uniref:FAD:protein FMN transferase n=1 Tax=Denitrobacterium detoxificans TaxID=79604 RepID=UPI0009EF0C95|nr:FAD:protein FMN transferase [Denitrobacterium detoxificans]